MSKKKPSVDELRALAGKPALNRKCKVCVSEHREFIEDARKNEFAPMQILRYLYENFGLHEVDLNQNHLDYHFSGGHHKQVTK